jgi:hypothetical protein
LKVRFFPAEQSREKQIEFFFSSQIDEFSHQLQSDGEDTQEEQLD